MQDTTCFVVVDPRPIHREGLISVLKSAGAHHCEAVCTVADIAGLSSAIEARPVILIDLPNGCDDLPTTIHALRKQLPDCRIVLLTPDCTESIIAQAVEAKLDGLLEETIECDALVKALELVTLGQTLFLTPVAFARWKAKSATEQDTHEPEHLLSLRELEVLRALTAGQPNKVIARACGITESTVKVHVKAILRKIHVQNRTQAAVWGQRFSRPILANGSGPGLPIPQGMPPLVQFAQGQIQLQPNDAEI